MRLGTIGVVMALLWSLEAAARATTLDSNPQGLVVFKGSLYFRADGGTNDGFHTLTWLWKTDGAPGTTVLVSDFGPSVSNPVQFDLEMLPFGNLLLIDLKQSIGTNLATSDGATIRPLTQLATGSPLEAHLGDSAVVGNFAFFTVDAAVSLRSKSIVRTDGTSAGTVIIGESRHPSPSMVAFQGALYFTDEENAVDTTTLIAKLDVVGSNSFELAGSTDGALATANALYFFDNNHFLSRTDGTVAGTTVVSQTAGHGPVVAAGSTLFFVGPDGAGGGAIWKSDGTAQGTTMVTPAALTGSYATAGNLLYYQTHDAGNGVEIWKTDGTPAGTVLLRDIGPGPTQPQFIAANVAVVGGSFYFFANDGTHGLELWTSDGTTDGTVLVQDINPGAGSSIPNDGTSATKLVAMGDSVYFNATDGFHGRELWRATGTTAVMVKDLNQVSSAPQVVPAVGRLQLLGLAAAIAALACARLGRPRRA
jgi:ELWxxDGT repeat protein